MDHGSKSEGMLQLEREIAELEKRVERGEIGTLLVLGEEYDRILRDAMAKMKDGEKDFIQRTKLRAHQEGAKILARYGHPVPGNDPTKPN